MTPTFRWVFLLALVGRAASVPRPLVVDACALLCNPGAETESERERDPVLFPRYPKVNCKLQSESDEDQAWIIASHCLKLCSYELTIPSEVNCFALRSSLQANLGCYCEALTPLSPNTMRLHESWRLKFLVKELSSDILNVILDSPLDVLILCEIHDELFKDVTLKGGKIIEKCKSSNAENITLPSRKKREDKEKEDPKSPEKSLTDEERHLMDWDDMLRSELDEPTMETYTEADYKVDEAEEHTNKDMLEQDVTHRPPLEDDEIESEDIKINEDVDSEDVDQSSQDQDSLMFSHAISEWRRVCKTLCKNKHGNQFCQCNNLNLN